MIITIAYYIDLQICLKRNNTFMVYDQVTGVIAIISFTLVNQCIFAASWYNVVFSLISFHRSEKSSKTRKRIANIIEYLTFEVFRYTVRGLYENHKFIFTLLLTLKIDLQNNIIEHNKFQILIKGKAIITHRKV